MNQGAVQLEKFFDASENPPIFLLKNRISSPYPPCRLLHLLARFVFCAGGGRAWGTEWGLMYER